MDGSDVIIVAIAAFTVIVGVLAYVQKIRNGRQCPECGHRLAHQDPFCQRCGYDFSMR